MRLKVIYEIDGLRPAILRFLSPVGRNVYSHHGEIIRPAPLIDFRSLSHDNPHPSPDTRHPTHLPFTIHPGICKAHVFDETFSFNRAFNAEVFVALSYAVAMTSICSGRGGVVIGLKSFSDRGFRHNDLPLFISRHTNSLTIPRGAITLSPSRHSALRFIARVA